MKWDDYFLQLKGIHMTSTFFLILLFTVKKGVLYVIHQNMYYFLM